MTNHPAISTNTIVEVRRTVKALRETYKYGPKTIQKAIRDGDLTSSSGTVSVELTIVEGEHSGAQAYSSKSGSWFAHYDALFENPDRSPKIITGEKND